MKSSLRNLYSCLRPPLWRLSLAVVSLLLLALTIGAQSSETKPSLTATTAEPTPLEIGKGLELPALTEEKYQKHVAPLPPNFLRIKQRPAKLSSQARFGYNLRFEAAPTSVSWILDGDEQRGYVLYADLNANGDLSDDAPFRFEQKEGKHSVLFSKLARDEKNQVSYPITIKLVVGQTMVTDDPQPQPTLHCYYATLRRGVLKLGNRELAFGLTGQFGLYGGAVVFDLNHDGQLDWNANGSLETYRLSEKEEEYVNLGETSYQIKIDRWGRSLTLNPLAEKRPARVFVSAGDLAPDFAFTDLEGKTRRLSDYRGKVVLLDFWGVWCSKCVAAVPKLVEAYEKLHAKGFEIIGIDGEDEKEVLQKFLAEKKMRWPQTLQEKSNGPIHKLYQYYAAPLYFLIGRDGKVLIRHAGEMNFLAELEKLLGEAKK
jgi:peroxiredoxin